jgi:hypothetical protein
MVSLKCSLCILDKGYVVQESEKQGEADLMKEDWFILP